MLSWINLLFYLLLSVYVNDNKQPIAKQSIHNYDSEKIVILGSSTAEGAGVSKIELSWVNRLSSAIKSESKENLVYNFGKSGYCTYHILPLEIEFKNKPLPDKERNINKALSLNPSLVIINMPSNDAAYGYSNDEQLRNYRIIVDKLKSKNIKYLICSPQPRNFKDVKVRDQQFQLHQLMSKEFSSNYVDSWSDLSSDDYSMKEIYNSGDGIHLNDAGHAIIYTKIYAKIKH